MATKDQEIIDGCFANAKDDEPMFVLLARDISAPMIVNIWADNREMAISRGLKPTSDIQKVYEARETARQMLSWRIQDKL